jgi:hypothetical protein
MNMTSGEQGAGNVIDFFSRRPVSTSKEERIIRLSLESDGLCMLYSNKANPNRLYSMNILCWALRQNGEVVGMVPWLNQLSPCTQLQDPLNGRWEGYYDPEFDDIFEEPPAHKMIELETAAEYFDTRSDKGDQAIQEIIDAIGTHAMLASDDFSSLTLTEVLSWRLYGDGRISAMLIAQNLITSTPVLPGDDCLYPAESAANFRYFFQHHIANQIKAEDPAALAAVALLMDK